VSEVETVRKDRRDTVTGEVRRGPTHVRHVGVQTWCGRKIRGFSVWNDHATLDDVDCVECKRALAADRPRSWKGR